MAEVTTRIIEDHDLTPSEKLVYLYIAAEYRSHYRNPVDCGSTGEVASDINYSAQTIGKALKRLESLGLIKVHNGRNWLTVELLHLNNALNLLRQLAGKGG